MTLIAIMINVIIKLFARHIIKQLDQVQTTTADMTKQLPSHDAVQNERFTLYLGSVAGMSVILLFTSILLTVFSTS